MTLSTSVGMSMTKSAVTSGESISLRKGTMTFMPDVGLVEFEGRYVRTRRRVCPGSTSSLKILMEGADDVAFESELVPGLFQRRLVIARNVVEMELEDVDAVELLVALELDVEGPQLIFLQAKAREIIGVALGIERVGRFGAVAVGRPFAAYPTGSFLNSTMLEKPSLSGSSRSTFGSVKSRPYLRYQLSRTPLGERVLVILLDIIPGRISRGIKEILVGIEQAAVICRLLPQDVAISQTARLACDVIGLELTALCPLGCDALDAGDILHRGKKVGEHPRAQGQQEEGDSQDDGFGRLVHQGESGLGDLPMLETSAFHSIISTRSIDLECRVAEKKLRAPLSKRCPQLRLESC